MSPNRVLRSSIATDKLREHQRAKLAAQVSDSTNAVLELGDDETGETLVEWYWYVNQIVKDYIERLTYSLGPGQLMTTERVSSLLTS
jgi:hypothetical protein